MCQSITHACISTDGRGKLTPNSTATVGSMSRTIPEETSRGGTNPILRISEALFVMGYRPIHRYAPAQFLRHEPGVLHIEVCPVSYW